MKNTKRFFSRFASLCLGMTMAVSLAVPAMADNTTPIAVTQASITAEKVLNVKDGKFPSMDTEFEFSMAKYKLFKHDGTEVADLTSMPAAAANAKATVKAADAPLANNANAKKAAAVFADIDFSGAAPGIYVYKINETKGAVPGLNYDTTDRYAAVYVVNLVDANNVIQLDTNKKAISTISKINIYKNLTIDFTNVTTDQQPDVKIGGGTPSGTKCSAVYEHANTYGAAGVTISTAITGAGSDATKTYEYTLNLKDSADKTDTTNYSYTITKADGTTTTGTITDGGKFTLGNGDKIVIDLPIGEKYTVTSPAIETGYSSKITGQAGTEVINVTDQTTAGEKTMSDPATSGNANNQTFTFNKGFNPPTGVMLDILPYALVVVLAGAGLTLALRKRKSEQ